ncbi:MAG: hypothetical protein WDA72_01355 [Desulfomonilia bacterium]
MTIIIIMATTATRPRLKVSVGGNKIMVPTVFVVRHEQTRQI